MAARICVIDYRRGNLASVHRGLVDCGFDAFISDKAEDILSSDGLLLPGVGSFADAMSFLNESGQADAIKKRVAEGAPFLGICLGLQLCYDRGDEGCPEGEWMEGLGLVPGQVVRMPSHTEDGRKFKVPHVGWNSVHVEGDNPLFKGIPNDSYFYFTHSYIGEPDSGSDIAATTEHAQRFVSSIRHGNVFATQFHPEKSSALGMKLFANFGELVEQYAQGGRA